MHQGESTGTVQRETDHETGRETVTAGGCLRCGEPMLPRLTGAATPVAEGAPLCADLPVRLACPTCT